jgi:probable F420-dependent oxidoreductase
MAVRSRFSLGIGLSPPADLARIARSAEDAGFDGLWSAEMFHDPFVPLAAAATQTSHIRLGTAIALAFVRSPWVTALAALDLDAISGGRFVLGLGTGLKRFNERWHGVAYGKPTPHIRECVQAIRLITERAHTGEPIRFHGQYYDIDIQGWQRPQAPVRERIPIYLAGVREGMIRTAGQVADGLIGHPIYPLAWIRDVVLPSIGRGLNDGGRPGEEFDLMLAVCCAVSEDVSQARRDAAATIAFYATVNTYEPLFARFPREVAAIQDAAMRADGSAMVDAVTTEMIDTFAVAGSVDDVRRKVAPYLELSDSICLTPPDMLIDPAAADAHRAALIAAFGR